MIEKASNESPDIQWVHADANEDLSCLGTFDVVFSNAALQWMPRHDELITKLYSSVNRGGILAVQIPEPRKMQIQTALDETTKSQKWMHIKIKKSIFTLDRREAYYDILSKLSNHVSIWETSYYHVMENHKQIIEWMRATRMKPYLECISNETEKKIFEDDVLNKLEEFYSLQENGRVLFPFKRMFFIAYKV